jgi:hypothetical protein
MAWTGDSDLNLNFKGGSMRFPHILHVPFADESFEYVDITDQLVKFFNPDDATKKIIGEIKAMEPIPIEKISIIPMD